MASGPEHYDQAVSDLAAARQASDEGRDAEAEFWQRQAQVHATLAHAAATALSAYGTTRPADYQAWVKACGEMEETATAAGEGAAG